MKAARPGQFMFITRQQAARLLRAARDRQAENRGERIGWVVSALKDSRHAQRQLRFGRRHDGAASAHRPRASADAMAFRAEHVPARAS
jgi:hypothetical protein